MRSEFAALCANNQLEVLRQVSPFGERLSIVEEKRSREILHTFHTADVISR
jgi:hypothetical protein